MLFRSLIQAYTHAQILTNNTNFIQFIQSGVSCILPSGFISLHFLADALTTATGNHIAHYTQTDVITHYCHQLSTHPTAQVHFIIAGHNHDPMQGIYCRPHIPDIKVDFAATFGITTHAAFLPANCLVTTADPIFLISKLRSQHVLASPHTQHSYLRTALSHPHQLSPSHLHTLSFHSSKPLFSSPPPSPQ